MRKFKLAVFGPDARPHHVYQGISLWMLEPTFLNASSRLKSAALGFTILIVSSSNLFGLSTRLLSLGRAGESVESFAISLRFEEKLAASRDQPSQASALSPGTLLLSYAFIGLAKIRAGFADGQNVFDTARELLQAQVENGTPEVRADAMAFLAQVAEAARRN